MSILENCLNANKISLNAKNKTELTIFKSRMCNFDGIILLKLKYLRDKIDDNINETLNWKKHINNIAINLNREHSLLFKIRKYEEVLSNVLFVLVRVTQVTCLRGCRLAWVKC